MRPRIAIDDHLSEFIDDAVKAGAVPDELTNLMRRVPKNAAEQLAHRYSRCGFRDECELLLSVVKKLGQEATDHLRETFFTASATKAADVLGMMARLDFEAVERILPKRLTEWKRSAHDRVVRQLESSCAPERGRLLLSIFDKIDPLIRPLALDEIALSGEHSGDIRLVHMAGGTLPQGSTEYLQLKAVEALGRLRVRGSEGILRRILETRQVWRWQYSTEFRIVAAQALNKIDPEFMEDFFPRSGLSESDLLLEPLDPDPTSPAARQRRYLRLSLDSPITGVTAGLKENYPVEISEMNLAGGVAVSERGLHPGRAARIGQQPHRVEIVENDHRLEDVQLEVALRSREADGRVVAHHLHATMVIASHWVGFTLPGMIEEPGSFSGSEISPMPQRGRSRASAGRWRFSSARRPASSARRWP
jgi:hypothetical protein